MSWTWVETDDGGGQASRVAWTPATGGDGPACWLSYDGVAYLLTLAEARELAAANGPPVPVPRGVAPAPGPLAPRTSVARDGSRAPPLSAAEVAIEVETSLPAPGATVRAPTAGRLCAIEVATGQAVAAGERVATLEAMKVEVPVRAAAAGRVAALVARAGDWVEAGEVLFQLA